jgi:hypothetical protein
MWHAWKSSEMYTGFWWGKPEGRRLFGTPKRRLEDSIRFYLKKRMKDHGSDLYGARQRPVAGCCECGNEPSGSIKCGEFLDEMIKLGVVVEVSYLT